MSDFHTLLAVKDLMKAEIVTAPSSITVTEAAKIMADKKVGSVVLTDGNGQATGIITDTDIVWNVVAEGKDASSLSSGDVRSEEIHKVEGGSSIFEARQLMTELKVKHMIVEEDGKPIGIISATALLGS